MADTDRLRAAVEHFAFYSRPSNADGTSTCTNSDLINVINKVSEVLNAFIDELEQLEI